MSEEIKSPPNNEVIVKAFWHDYGDKIETGRIVHRYKHTLLIEKDNGVILTRTTADTCVDEVQVYTALQRKIQNELVAVIKRGSDVAEKLKQAYEAQS